MNKNIIETYIFICQFLLICFGPLLLLELLIALNNIFSISTHDKLLWIFIVISSLIIIKISQITMLTVMCLNILKVNNIYLLKLFTTWKIPVIILLLFMIFDLFISITSLGFNIITSMFVNFSVIFFITGIFKLLYKKQNRQKQ